VPQIPQFISVVHNAMQMQTQRPRIGYDAMNHEL